MAEQRESSMLFSLRGLMDVEASRVERAAAERRNVLLESRAAQAEDQRDREFREALRRRDDVELLIALQEAEARARIELLQREHAHQQRLAAMRAEARQVRDRQLTCVLIAAVVVTLAVSFGLYFGKLRPEARRLHRAYDELAEAERRRAEAAQVLLDRARRQRDEAVDGLVTAQRELARMRAQRSAPATSTASSP